MRNSKLAPLEVEGLVWRHTALTVAVFVPLAWTFVNVINFYPIPVWSLFSDHVDLSQGRTYYILGGETVGGEQLEIPAISITDALTGRIHMMVYYVMGNSSLFIESPHPNNVKLVVSAGGRENVPPGARVPDLLAAWGNAYNGRLAKTSSQRLRRIWLKQYRWPGGSYSDYRQFVREYEVRL
jgi:hypothetical protein